jgi:hypothetical protein
MTSTDIPTITTVLSIGGHQFNPDELTSLIGVEPTKIWNQEHEWIKSSHPDFETIAWEHELEKQRRWSLGEAIGELLNVIWSKKDEIKLFMLQYQLTMHVDCRPFGDASRIEYNIQSEVMMKMAFFGASLSLAVYKDEL